MLPADARSCQLSTVHGVCLTLSITDPGSPRSTTESRTSSRAGPFRFAPRRRTAAPSNKGLGIRRQLDRLRAMFNGPAPGILIGTGTAHWAVEPVDYRLDRLFT
ncbi:hypothetical protein [Streptomyces sp. NBC_01320]|uniref:hypothetical protein n=1 Tax=Streptomyces sp. NBC_01320 TaxID=2903824 RepID=UPI002E100C52|nr:hypothetical protein OG395_05315 [Streptomyces sp. NBC_01320]